MTSKLRLGPIPKQETVRLTIALTSTLKADIDRYAELHAQTWGEAVDAAGIVPHMVETFMARDRGFKKSRDKGNASGSSSKPEVAKIHLPSPQS